MTVDMMYTSRIFLSKTKLLGEFFFENFSECYEPTVKHNTEDNKIPIYPLYAAR